MTQTEARRTRAPGSRSWRWMRENLFTGEWWGPIAANAILTIVAVLISLNLSRFVTTYLFNPDRKWSAVTYNMKNLMVQAFPQEGLVRIWISLGIFGVLVAWSLASWEIAGRIPVHKLLYGLRFGGFLLSVITLLHHGAGAQVFGLPPLLQFDSPADWSTIRLWIFVVALVAGVGAHLLLRSLDPTHSRSIPTLLLPAGAMALITLFLWTVWLPFPEGQFEQTTAPIASTTARPWTILFVIAVVGYFVGLYLHQWQPRLFRRFLITAWIASYPIIIMVIQRNPVLDWADILGFGETSFLTSDLGTVLIAGIIGVLALWVLGLPNSKNAVFATALWLGACLVGGAWLIGELPAWLDSLVPLGNVTLILLGGLLALAMAAGAWLVSDRTESVRIIGSTMALAGAMVWLLPMPFLYRALVTVFAIFALLAPTFGGTTAGRRNLTIGWVITVVLVVAAFRLGVAESTFHFQTTTFLGGFNLTILLAITGIALSFPLGVVLALARTSSMPVFRLLAVGYIELVRSVPLITWLFFGASMLVAFLPSGVQFDDLVGVIGALTIFNSAYVAENIRGGLQSVGSGQYEAARAVGLSTVQSNSLIILPQAIRAIIPALVSSIIISFKDTSLVAIIGLFDILLIARSAIPNQSNPSFQGTLAQMMFFMALFYWVFTFTISRLSLRYERNIGLGKR